MKFSAKVHAAYTLADYDEEHEEQEEGEEEEDKPEDDDIFIEPTGQLGSQLSLSAGGKHVGDFDENDEVEKAIVDWMNKHKFYPNIWFISDHGNVSPYQLEEKFAKQVK